MTVINDDDNDEEDDDYTDVISILIPLCCRQPFRFL